MRGWPLGASLVCRGENLFFTREGTQGEADSVWCLQMAAPRIAAGLLMYRTHGGGLEVFLVHPGGPYFQRRDAGVWGIPKGAPEGEETLLEAAKREFLEETGFPVYEPLIPLGEIVQKGGKRVHCWAFEADLGHLRMVSNPCRIEWPPRSGQWQEFPEADQGRYFTPEEAKNKIIPEQFAFVERLLKIKGVYA